MDRNEWTDVWEHHQENCNDAMIGSYNNYHLSPNSIPSGNQRWYGLVYLVYKWLVNLGQGLGNS